MKTYKILSKTCDKLLVTLLLKNKMLQPTFSTEADYNIVLESDITKLEKLNYSDIKNVIIVLQVTKQEISKQTGGLKTSSKAENALRANLRSIRLKNTNILSTGLLVEGFERNFHNSFIKTL